MAAPDPSRALKRADEHPLVGLDLSRCNRLHPVQATQRVSPYHVARLSIVAISPNPADGDVYNSGAFMGRDEVALTKQGLNKLADAAGVTWDTRESGLQPSPDPDIIIYRAVGIITGMDGQPVRSMGIKEVDTRENGTEAELIQMQADRNQKLKTAADREAYCRREMTRIRQHRVAMAETKAKLRVIREFINVKSKYGTAELRQPFVVPHLDFSPDLTDPDVRELTAARGLEAVRALFGPPQAEHIEHRALTAAPQESAPYDPETGEVLDAGEGTQVSSGQDELSLLQRHIFAVAAEIETCDRKELLGAIKARVARWAGEFGRDICGWRDGQPSLSASTVEQRRRIVALYERERQRRAEPEAPPWENSAEGSALEDQVDDFLLAMASASNLSHLNEIAQGISQIRARLSEEQLGRLTSAYTTRLRELRGGPMNPMRTR